MIDLTSLEKAIISLQKILRRYELADQDDDLRDACIQRFEYTYELSWKNLRRFLEETDGSPESLATINFADLIRMGNEKGLLKGNWLDWKAYREARSISSHTYDEEKAENVYSQIPKFAEEAEFLMNQMKLRLTNDKS